MSLGIVLGIFHLYGDSLMVDLVFGLRLEAATYFLSRFTGLRHLPSYVSVLRS